MNFQNDSASLAKQVCMPFYERDHWESVYFKLNFTFTFLLDLAASLPLTKDNLYIISAKSGDNCLKLSLSTILPGEK
jgi:hypothetical protein